MSTMSVSVFCNVQPTAFRVIIAVMTHKGIFLLIQTFLKKIKIKFYSYLNKHLNLIAADYG
jgi:hypothetical protein